ncbi:hypothetical protein PRIPAC_78405 [Pristionchus pacificus]|uniref:Uncharacterized protein n=1 Tax=Pristionchus pacificus TaxID=54126 RepID=A0A2A6BYC6_PRIPA|nr:hypothetical protein PRIPAC_78405 [Pristionchus pacificus]|eukprot:PDM70846.1 hypothetical protein PRIPAC_45050 [Pristionchus pacificus]
MNTSSAASSSSDVSIVTTAIPLQIEGAASMLAASHVEALDHIDEAKADIPFCSIGKFAIGAVFRSHDNSSIWEAIAPTSLVRLPTTRVWKNLRNEVGVKSFAAPSSSRGFTIDEFFTMDPNKLGLHKKWLDTMKIPPSSTHCFFVAPDKRASLPSTDKAFFAHPRPMDELIKFAPFQAVYGADRHFAIQSTRFASLLTFARNLCLTAEAGDHAQVAFASSIMMLIGGALEGAVLHERSCTVDGAGFTVAVPELKADALTRSIFAHSMFIEIADTILSDALLDMKRVVQASNLYTGDLPDEDAIRYGLKELRDALRAIVANGTASEDDTADSEDENGATPHKE